MAFKGTRPSDEEQSAREARAWELRQKGWSQARIAVDLGITQQGVSTLLRRLARQFARDFKKRAEEVKAEQTAVLEFMVDEALQEWERSKLPIEKQSIKGDIFTPKRNPESDDDYDEDDEDEALAEQDAQGQPVGLGVAELTKKTEGRLADPRYLQQARDAMGDVRKIWGIDAPEKIEVDQKLSGEVTVNDAAKREGEQKLDSWRHEMKEQLEAMRANSPLATPTAPISPTTSAE